MKIIKSTALGSMAWDNFEGLDTGDGIGEATSGAGDGDGIGDRTTIGGVGEATSGAGIATGVTGVGGDEIKPPAH